MTPIGPNGVLWLPAGVLFPINGEAAALVFDIAAGTLIATALSRGVTARWSRPLVLLACALIGLTANMHSYGFLDGLALLLCVFAAIGLALQPSWRRIGLSVLGLILLYPVGTYLLRHVNPLAPFVGLLLPTAPGLLVILRRYLRLSIYAVVLIVVCAAPQFILLATGYMHHDPILEYRQQSSGPQHVPFLQSVKASLPILGICLVVGARALLRRAYVLTAVTGGLLIGFFLMGENAHWGLKQEPYRLWIGCYAVVAYLLVPIAAKAFSAETDRRKTSLRARAILAASLVAGLGTYAAGIPDVVQFWRTAKSYGVISLTSPDMIALGQVAHDLPGLVGYENCIDPLLLKLVSNAHVAYYNLGMGWPEEDVRKTVDEFVTARASGSLDVNLLKSGKISSVITRSDCEFVWGTRYRADLKKIRSVSFESDHGTVTYTAWTARKN
jgi:hypothetical protein